ncbi:hypothetical protein [Celeribacter baekdonensis]|uniref:hypothetical protein n=1 Tax=Celeribacter baekdonensis TaxID=875171 RepID=UPI003A926F91
MELVTESYIRTQDFRPVVEDLEYTRITFTLPKNIIGFTDRYDEMEHREVPVDERRLLGLLLCITRHTGYRIKKRLLEELFLSISEWDDLFEDADAEELVRFVEACIREHHVHGPFSAKGYEDYLASKVNDEEEDPAEAA